MWSFLRLAIQIFKSQLNMEDQGHGHVTVRSWWGHAPLIIWLRSFSVLPALAGINLWRAPCPWSISLSFDVTEVIAREVVNEVREMSSTIMSTLLWDQAFPLRWLWLTMSRIPNPENIVPSPSKPDSEGHRNSEMYSTWSSLIHVTIWFNVSILKQY